METHNRMASCFISSSSIIKGSDRPLFGGSYRCSPKGATGTDVSGLHNDSCVFCDHRTDLCFRRFSAGALQYLPIPPNTYQYHPNTPLKRLPIPFQCPPNTARGRLPLQENCNSLPRASASSHSFYKKGWRVLMQSDFYLFTA